MDKGQVKLTGFLITLVLVAMFAGLFGILISKVATEYNVDYNNTGLTTFSDKMGEINDNVENITVATKVDAESDWTDILGGYFKAGYRAIRTSQTAIGLYDDMANDVLTSTNLGDDDDGKSAMSFIKTGLITIMLIMIFVGIFVSILVKRDIL